MAVFPQLGIHNVRALVQDSESEEASEADMLRRIKKWLNDYFDTEERIEREERQERGASAREIDRKAREARDPPKIEFRLAG